MLAQVAQGCCGVSIFADIERLLGYNHGQLALCDPAEQGVGPDDLQRSFQTSTTVLRQGDQSLQEMQGWAEPSAGV